LEGDADRRLESWVAPAGGGDDLLQLGQHRTAVLSRDRPPFEAQEAPGGVRAHLLATLDERGVDRTGSKERMARPAARPLVKLGDLREDRAGRRDRVDTEIRSRPVGRNAAHLQLEPD